MAPATSHDTPDTPALSSAALSRQRRGQVKAEQVRAGFAALRCRIALRAEWSAKLEAGHLTAFSRPVGLAPVGGWISGAGCDGLPEPVKEDLRALAHAQTAAGERAHASLRQAFPRAYRGLWALAVAADGPLLDSLETAALKRTGA